MGQSHAKLADTCWDDCAENACTALLGGAKGDRTNFRCSTCNPGENKCNPEATDYIPPSGTENAFWKTFATIAGGCFAAVVLIAVLYYIRKRQNRLVQNFQDT